MVDTIDSLKKDAKEAEKTLRDSPSSFYGDTKPTNSDLYKDLEFRKIRQKLDAARDDEIKDRWFTGDSERRQGGHTKGFGRIINMLSMPVYATTGAFEHVLGKGTEGTLKENVNRNMAEGRRTMGDLLKKYGAPTALSAPLGFALDITFDPLNWASAGTAALIPRMITGLAKKGPVGLTKAVTSSALRKGSALGKFTPFLRNSEKYTDFAKKSIKASKEYDEMIGNDIMKRLAKNRGLGWGQSEHRLVIRDQMEKLMDAKIPVVSSFVKALDYNNIKWMELARKRDSMLAVFGTSDDAARTMKSVAEGGDSAKKLQKATEGFEQRLDVPFDNKAKDELFMDADGAAAEVPMYERGEIEEMGEGLEGLMEKIQTSAEDANDLLDDANNLFTSVDPEENAFRLAMELAEEVITPDDIKKMISSRMLNEVGIKWYDDAAQKIREFNFWTKTKNKDKIVKKGEETVGALQKLKKIFSYDKSQPFGDKALDVADTGRTFFKLGKVGSSPSAWVNAILGNPTMAFMFGVNISDPKYLSHIRKAFNIQLSRKGSLEAIREMYEFLPMAQYLDDPLKAKEFARSMGISPGLLKEKVRLGEQAYNIVKNSSFGVRGMTKEQAIRAAAKEMENVAESVAGAYARNTTQRELGLELIESAGGVKGAANRGVSNYDFGLGYLSSETLTSDTANKILRGIRKAAEEDGNVGAKILNVIYNKAMTGYERIDQTYRLGTKNYFTLTGVSAEELLKMSRAHPISADDILEVVDDLQSGFQRYKISPEKSLEMANEIYLNYQAMPAAVRMLRSTHVLGAPFASFMYGMTTKTASTMVYNPAVFNKINYGIKEFSAEKSPIEKRSMEGPYYSYLNDPAMFKTPFFGKNGAYINLANVLPYYTLNMFNPSERPHREGLPGALINAVDKLPIFDDPAGQTFIDYILLPAILGDETPHGMFGQPIFPKDVTLLERLGLTARNLADAYSPGALAALGLAGPVIPDGMEKYFPGYNTRKVMLGTKGKTSYGTSGREAPSGRTFRNIMAVMGAPVQSPINESYTIDELEDGKN